MVIVFETILRKSFANNKIRKIKLEIFTYINYKCVYVEKHIRSQMKNSYHEILVQHFKIEEESLRNALAIADSSSAIFSYELMKGWATW